MEGLEEEDSKGRMRREWKWRGGGMERGGGEGVGGLYHGRGNNARVGTLHNMGGWQHSKGQSR
jgi:hypothetical protein